MRPLPFSGPRARIFVFAAALPPFLFFACGSRTALPTYETPVADAGDASQAPDVRISDARRDTAPDVVVPTIDAQVRDANRDDCPDADATLIYVVSETNELLAFNPPAATFRAVGLLDCPATGVGARPFSMAVDRTGVAFVLFDDGELFRVSTKTAACVATNFTSTQGGFPVTFGMGFSSNNGGSAETLFVAGDVTAGGSDLASIDVTSFTLTDIGTFVPNINRAELTGTGDGRLFAFYQSNSGVGTAIGEIDKTTAAIVAEDQLSTVPLGTGWAFGYWGGDFYTFTAPDGASSVVTRFDPTTKQLTQVANYPSIIVGAGVSTCAPQK